MQLVANVALIIDGLRLQRIFHQNHPKLSVDEFKVSETDLPSSRPDQQHQQEEMKSFQSHPRDKSLWAVTYNSMANVSNMGVPYINPITLLCESISAFW